MACPDRWLSDQEHVPIKLRVGIPAAPAAELPTSLKDQAKCKAWNDEAYAIAMDNRNKCPYCERGFFSDKIVRHINVCPKKPKNADVEAVMYGTKKTTAKPSFFMEFGTASITIHLPQCFERFKSDQALMPESCRRPIPDLDAMMEEIAKIKEDGIITKAEFEEQRENAMKAYKDGLATCPNCNRTFESAALEKHLKGCKVREFKFGLVVQAPDDDEEESEEDDGTGTKGVPDPEDLADLDMI
ncbi:uncharacterized protein MONOS_5931 [Monocercomonoides exilis]|uniref:uncharacterized protein n=1 Tax=Monocercomonoides exilis TaxID=2049356 RepID=UPI00355A9BD2|nr:hypothetical protein MONOS_5931 [Monocercomonoides exilis]|eukprot:MONOS_5931.1-p1 / transcript=MONOS_5931.1 / gene=MONOS_5931 / organism=Monocercomonoides_exilis_PA203 / gene_product=unspecified product / transcript_product=unspecified product / location=Mono_scaffold00179:23650-24787(-) / protein_length=242 / sequence_SO=supercontig / SO=protein_coding / is_pseudo=false